jgi:hypothetical protein
MYNKNEYMFLYQAIHIGCCMEQKRPRWKSCHKGLKMYEKITRRTIFSSTTFSVTKLRPILQLRYTSLCHTHVSILRGSTEGRITLDTKRRRCCFSDKAAAHIGAVGGKMRQNSSHCVRTTPSWMEKCENGTREFVCV